MTPFICAGCSEPIMERFLMKVLDKSWHVQCVKCSDCQCLLSEKCFSRDNKLYCRSDFFRQYGTQCASCKEGLCPEDLVRRGVNKIYHVQCFKCSVCQRQLNTGEQLYLVQGEKFLCDSCYPAPAPSQPTVLQQQQQSSSPPPPSSQPIVTQTTPINPPPTSFTPAANPVGSGATAVSNVSAMDESYSPSTTGNDPLIGSGDNRKGKTRTSINPKQLIVLQATYEKEPRPSRAMREELAAQTGLTAKVIQVWFQNRRSKDKKDGTKGEPGAGL